MKSKKFTAWILVMAMLVTMLPSSLALATGDHTTPAPYPVIVTDVFSEMTNDISGVDKGTDLDLTGTTNDALPTVNSAVGAETVLDGVDGTVYHNADSEINNMRRKQILTFVAKSQDDSNFINSSTSTGVAEHAVEIAYLDTDREPLEIDLDSEEFEVIGSGDWSNAWIDLSQDVQQTDRTLETFLTKELEGINPELLTAAQLFATGDMVSFMIYNVIRSDFAGYLRIKITDNNGNTTVQDYPIVADGQYPAVSISTSTYKNPVGENVENSAVTTVAENTFINEMDFVTVMEDTEENKEENETDNIHKSYRWHNLDKDALQNALNWEDENYKPEDIWAMGDISIDEIKISDLLVTSGIESVKYSVANYGLKENVTPSTLEGTIELTYDPATKTCSAGTPIVISNEGFNVLAITAVDNSGLKTTNRYYFYMDTTAPKAKFDLVELDKNVVSLFTDADTVTNRQQAIDMSESDDVTASVDVISGLEDATAGETENNKMYQYRLLATKAGATEGGNVPDGYTATVLDKEGNDLSGWKIWTGETETPVIDKEFDGIVQVRVQDRAGNWSPIVSVTSDGKETIITDNTNPVIDVKEYALDTNGDTIGNTDAEIIGGTATDILITSARVTETTDGEIENEVIHTITGDVAPWINDSAVLEVKITDEDLANEIRSSGLKKGQINVTAEFNAENENKKVKIWNKNGVDKKNVDDSFNLTEDYIFGTETDKDLTFYIEYEGTGVVDITVSVKDQADVNDGDVFSTIYTTQLRVDKINPYIIYKGYDITDKANEDLLKANHEKVDYEVRNMPWGPNSQVLEVVVKDDDITPIQSKTKNIRFNADKELDLYEYVGGVFTKIKTYAAGNDNVVSLSDCEELANEKYESNVGYKFYLVYEGTGIAKVEFFADDSATAPNVRDYPSIATAAEAEPVLYDAMLRVDKINPEIKNVKLVETDIDVEDKGWSLFSFNETNVEVNTRKQMKITFEIVDENTTTEQSGVNIQNEKISGVDLIDVYKNYVEKDKTHLYDNKPTTYTTDDVNDKAVDPNIDYILLPVEAGSINGTGGNFEEAASASNEAIEALVAEYLDKVYNADGDKCEWKKASWKDGGIVVPDEFQGAIVIRTIDRVGNIDYAEAITFVAESREALIDFNPQNGYIWSQNNYGWSKRDYDYVEIRVKDDNEDKVDAWLENVFISVTDLEGNDISTKETVKFAPNDPSLKIDPSAYTYVSLSDFTNEAAYGYDVIDAYGLVEKLYRDSEGYIHLGYVRVAESAQIKVTIFDKAKHNDVEYTGNKTTGIWTSRIDRTAPTVNVKVVAIPASEHGAADNNKVVLGLKADIIDNESGVAPYITDGTYNVYTPENVPASGVFASDKSFLYKVTNDADAEVERFDSGTFNTRQYELPGLQYALIPENGKLENVKPWNFETDPKTVYDENGYNGNMGATYVWHNYVDDKTPILPEEGFDGYIVVRAIDKAGNITVIGCAPTIDIEAAEGWQKETQLIHVKASPKTGNITTVEYMGNNNLLTHDEAGNLVTRNIYAEAISGAGTFIEVTEEGITDVIITASEEYTAQQTVKAASDERNATWEGSMIVGNATPSGYEDFKFQTVQVKIDKTAPTFEFTLVDAANEEIVTSSRGFGIKVADGEEIVDPIPNLPDVVGYRSHISSGIAKVEYCVASEGMEEWHEVDKATWETGVIKAYEDNAAITGTVKVRVTDNAGNVTEKSKSINIDSAIPIISISKSYDSKWSNKPVEVKVTVSSGAEFSDISSVYYTVTGGTEGELPVTGGTITIGQEGVYEVSVKALTKSGKSLEAWTDVHIDWTAPDFELELTDGEDVLADGAKTGNAVTVNVKDIIDNVSGVKSIEWCKVAEGSVNEQWNNITSAKTATIEKAEAFTGTVKVRVTDEAGNVTVKTQRVIHNDDVAMPELVGVASGSWKIDNDTVTVASYADDKVKVRYSNNGEPWTDVIENSITLVPGANRIRLQAYREDCGCESDVRTYVINYEPIENTPIIDIRHDYGNKYMTVGGSDFEIVNSTNESVTVSLVPNKGTCEADIQSVVYDLYLNGVATEKNKNIYLPITGGTLTLSEEGEWAIGNVRITTESGKEYNLLPDYQVVALIDKTAPVFDNAETKLVGIGGELTLFGLAEPTNEQQKLTAKAKDNCITYKGGASTVLFYEYALLEKGMIEPNWEPLKYEWNDTKVETDAIITTSFEGTVLVRVTDVAGNSSVKSIQVFAEGTKPEISITAPSSWQTEDVMIKVDVVDKGLSSTIKSVTYELLNGAHKEKGELSSIGGSIEITREGITKVKITAEDYAGNIETIDTCEVKIDKTAPEYSGIVELLGVYNEHEIPESKWNVIHDGWTYNHNVSLEGIEDTHSGIKKVNITFTGDDGAVTETTLNSSQTSSSFSENGKYDLTLIDNAGNVRNISFTINKDLQNVINVIGIDEFGKLNIAVTDGDDMLTFYKKENSESKYTKMYNGITNQLIDGKTGVRYIYGQNDAGKKSNTLYVIVAPSTEYGISLMSLSSIPNRYLNIDAEGEKVTVTKIDEIFNPGINENISVGSVVEINEDGIYSITTND
ncbi:MAG: Ig-like domain repeat protein [Clostridia bacterium]